MIGDTRRCDKCGCIAISQWIRYSYAKDKWFCRSCIREGMRTGKPVLDDVIEDGTKI